MAIRNGAAFRAFACLGLLILLPWAARGEAAPRPRDSLPAPLSLGWTAGMNLALPGYPSWRSGHVLPSVAFYTLDLVAVAGLAGAVVEGEPGLAALSALFLAGNRLLALPINLLGASEFNAGLVSETGATKGLLTFGNPLRGQSRRRYGLSLSSGSISGDPVYGFEYGGRRIRAGLEYRHSAEPRILLGIESQESARTTLRFGFAAWESRYLDVLGGLDLSHAVMDHEIKASGSRVTGASHLAAAVTAAARCYVTNSLALDGQAALGWGTDRFLREQSGAGSRSDRLTALNIRMVYWL